MIIARKIDFKIPSVLAIKVTSSTYVSKELWTRHGWPVVFCRNHSAETLSPPLRKKSSGLDELQETPILLFGVLKPLQPPLVAPLVLPTVTTHICVCDLRIMGPAAVTLLGS
jgi:hypothetical protein